MQQLPPLSERASEEGRGQNRTDEREQRMKTAAAASAVRLASRCLSALRPLLPVPPPPPCHNVNAKVDRELN